MYLTLGWPRPIQTNWKRTSSLTNKLIDGIFNYFMIQENLQKEKQVRILFVITYKTLIFILQSCPRMMNLFTFTGLLVSRSLNFSWIIILIKQRTPKSLSLLCCSRRHSGCWFFFLRKSFKKGSTSRVNDWRIWQTVESRFFGLVSIVV